MQRRGSKLSHSQDILRFRVSPKCNHHGLEASYPWSLPPYFRHQGLSPRHQCGDCNHIGKQPGIANRRKPLLRARCSYLGSFNTGEMHQPRCLPNAGIFFPINDGSDYILDAPTHDLEATHDNEAQIPIDICLRARWLVCSSHDDCFAWPRDRRANARSSTCITRVLQIIATSRLDFDDITWSNVYFATWNLVEVHIGCVTANVPVMAPLVNRYSTAIPRLCKNEIPGPIPKSHVGNGHGFRRMEEHACGMAAEEGALAPTIGMGQQLSEEELEMAGLGAQGILVRTDVEQNSYLKRPL